MGADTRDGHYYLGKEWIGQAANGKFRYDERLISKQFLTPQPPVYSTPGRKQVLCVSIGELHVVAVARTNGAFAPRVFVTGTNSYGQLGLEDPKAQYHELTPVS